ncbi:MAG: hypothetical protein JJU12_02415 [Chlamydiales bacterium]|nr:hypothetical protein [Chlamydiales bacterium]
MNPKGLNILDALDNLNALVDAKTLDEIEVTEEARLIQHKGEVEEATDQGLQDVYWVRAGPDDQTVHVIKETFRSVFDYLQIFYQKMKNTGDTKKLVEGVNTIMVLVGEAAKNLDRFGAVFKERVSEFPEYKELQSFYRKKVIRESFREFAKTPIPKEEQEVLSEQEEWEEELKELLGGEEEVEEIAGVHILNDIDVIKRDHLYELFYLKNEAGYNFFTFDLARNIKLACDFGEFAEEYFGDDPLLQIKNWEDKELHLFALSIGKVAGRAIEKFYAEAMKYKEMEAVSLLHNACMALMLASNPRNLLRQFSLKGCHRYFADFLFFLREVLHNREFEKLVIYGTPPGNTFFPHYLDLVHLLCRLLYTEWHDQRELSEAIQEIVARSEPKQPKRLSDALIQANRALTEALKKHPNGPVFKAVDIVREEEERRFDPLMQGNLPALEWVLKRRGSELKMVHLPCPIEQEWINHAVVSEEFKTFLRGCDPEERLLIINFQDRTSWREHARSAAIEDLAQQAEFAPNLTVVTLAKDTDFYNQSGVYQELGEAEDFIAQFADHLSEVNTGYYFPTYVSHELFPEFIDALLPKIHETFFERKTRLSYLERLDFIQLVYHFIELKLIELIKPTYLALTSKDALDIGATSTIGFLALLAVGRGKKLDYNKIQASLFGPTLMQRERVIHPERFDRLCALIRLLEEKGDYLEPFAPLFRKETFEWEIA